MAKDTASEWAAFLNEIEEEEKQKERDAGKNVIPLFPKKRYEPAFFCEPCRGTGKLIKFHGGNPYAYRCPCPAGSQNPNFAVWNERLRRAK